MTIRFSCSCGNHVSAPESTAGRSTRCPQCRQPLTVPRLRDELTMPTSQAQTEQEFYCRRCGKKCGIRLDCLCGEIVCSELCVLSHTTNCKACGRARLRLLEREDEDRRRREKEETRRNRPRVQRSNYSDQQWLLMGLGITALIALLAVPLLLLLARK